MFDENVFGSHKRKARQISLPGFCSFYILAQLSGSSPERRITGCFLGVIFLESHVKRMGKHGNTVDVCVVGSCCGLIKPVAQS